MTAFLHRKEYQHNRPTTFQHRAWDTAPTLRWLGAIVICTLFLCFIGADVRAQKLHFDRLTIAEGLSSNSVYSILQESQGALLFGTLDGLNRYDGYTISSYDADKKTNGSVSNSRVTFMFEDKLHQLWLYDEFTGTMTRHNTALDDYSSYDLNLLADNGDMATLFAAHEDKDGNICVQSVRGITLCYQLRTDAFRREPEAPERVLSIANDPKWEHLLPAFDEHLKHRSGTSSLDHLSIKEIIRDVEGRYWIATEFDGLYTATEQNGRFEFISHLHTNDKFHKIESEQINDLYEDSSNVIWIATRNYGLYRYTPFKLKFNLLDEVVVDQERRAIGTVRAIAEDMHGNLWIGTSGEGLLRVIPTLDTARQYLPVTGNEHGIGSRFIRSLWLDEYNELWVGHYGGFSKYRKATADFKQYVPTIPSNEEVRVYDFKKGTSDNLWIAAWDVILKYNVSNDTYDFIARSMTDAAGFKNQNIREVEVDDAGDLWLAAGEKGLSIYNKATNRFININHHGGISDELPSSNIFDIHKDTKGNVWLSTANGLCLFDPATLNCQTYNMADGLPSRLIYGVLEDDRGCLWMSTTKGISKFDMRTRTFRNYDVSDGLQSNEFTENAFFKNEKGIMFFGGIKGLNYFDPNHVPDNQNPPKLAVTGIKVYDQPLTEVAVLNSWSIQNELSSHGEIFLSAGQNSISFEFAAYHFVEPLKNKYAFMLEGFDNDWTYRDANARFANYTNLEPGTYYFLLKASNSDGVWTGEPLRLKIVLDPPFYATSWFILSSLLGLLSIGVWGYKKRIAVLKKQQTVKSARLESELNFLKSQVNPHFLFNTLNNIYALCQVNSVNAAPMVGKISEMMRYMIYDCNAPRVSLKKEIDYLQNYIDLNQLKTNRPLKVSFRLEGEIGAHKIAPLLLINFLENSFKHGDLHSNRHGFIDLRLSIEDTKLTFMLANSFKNQTDPQEDHQGIGLENVKSRLSLLYPDKYKLRIEKKMTSFEVELKLELD
jgi:ligand-binding sensor domain-containing protein